MRSVLILSLLLLSASGVAQEGRPAGTTWEDHSRDTRYRNSQQKECDGQGCLYTNRRYYETQSQDRYYVPHQNAQPRYTYTQPRQNYYRPQRQSVIMNGNGMQIRNSGQTIIMGGGGMFIQNGGQTIQMGPGGIFISN